MTPLASEPTASRNHAMTPYPPLSIAVEGLSLMIGSRLLRTYKLDARFKTFDA